MESASPDLTSSAAESKSGAGINSISGKCWMAD